MTVLDFPEKAIGSPGTCEVAGMRMGIRCAKKILADPDVPAVIITTIYLAEMEKVIEQYRASGHLTDAQKRTGEAFTRDGPKPAYTLQSAAFIFNIPVPRKAMEAAGLLTPGGIVHWSDPVDALTKVIQAQRHVPFPSDDGKPVYCVGGFAELTVINAAGMHQRVVLRWPDGLDTFIDPNRTADVIAAAPANSDHAPNSAPADQEINAPFPRVFVRDRAAAQFGVGVNTAIIWVRRFRETGSFAGLCGRLSARSAQSSSSCRNIHPT